MSYSSLAAKESATSQNSYQTPYSSIVLHVPHAKSDLPDDIRQVLAATPSVNRLLQGRSNSYIDWFTDEHFVPSTPHPRIHSIVFPWCRIYCDVERLPHDPLEAKGLGISMFRCDCFKDRADSFRTQCYRDYMAHQRSVEDLLMKCSTEGRTSPNDYPPVLLIDCHSFSTTPTELCTRPSDIDICIGYNDDWSRPTDAVLQRVAAYFQEKGYKVGLNTPFSNSKTVDAPVDYHSLMLEVSKRLYMNEDTLTPSNHFANLQNDLQSLYPLLLSPNRLGM